MATMAFLGTTAWQKLRTLGSRLSVRLYLLVALAVLPALLIQAFHEIDVRRERNAQVAAEAERLASLLAADMDRLTEAARIQLSTFARVESVRRREPQACSEAAAALVRETPQFVRLGAIDATGRWFCASEGRDHGSIPTPSWFAAASAANAFHIAGYFRGERTGRDLFVLAHPFRAPDGGPGGFVALALDLDQLAVDLRRQRIPTYGSVSVASRGGTVLMRLPETEVIGRPMAESIRWMLEARVPGSLDVRNPDGTERIVGYVPPLATEGDYFLSLVGIDKAYALRDVEIASRRNLTVIAIGLLLAGLAAWAAARVSIHGPIESLARAADRIGQGDMSARAKLTGGVVELRRLGRAFDEMAAAIESRTSQLRASERRFLRTIETAAVPMLAHAEDGEVLAVSEGFLRLTGYSREQLRRFEHWLELAYGRRGETIAARLARLFERDEPVVGIEADVRTAEGTLRRWAVNSPPPERLGDGRKYYVTVAADITEAYERRRLLDAILRAAPIVLHVRDVLTRRYIFASPQAGSILGIDASEASGASVETFVERVHPEDRERLVEFTRLLDHALGDEIREIEYRVARGEGWRWVNSRAMVLARDATGAPRQIVGATIDVQERRETEERLQLLLAELSHRVKNTLAVVQAIARQTGARAADVPAFMRSFEGRLQALSAAHETLMGTGWRGASLRALVERALAAHRRPESGRFDLAIERDISVRAEAAQDLSLVLHELATNAAKYGALSRRGGRVAIRASTEMRAEGEWLLIEWRELGGPEIESPPEGRGFGTTLIERIIALQRGGRVGVEWPRGGVVYRIELPLASLRERGE